jgi:hypothetical protein
MWAGRMDGKTACHGYHNADHKPNAASASHGCGYGKLPVEYNVPVADMQKRLKMDGLLNDFLKE